MTSLLTVVSQEALFDPPPPGPASEQELKAEAEATLAAFRAYLPSAASQVIAVVVPEFLLRIANWYSNSLSSTE